MQNKPFLILCCAIAGLGALAVRYANASNGEWQCRAGADGNWDCTSVTPAGIPSPAGAAARPAKASRQTVATGADTRAQSMDWVSIENLTPEQRSAISTQCHGAYVEPPVDAAGRGETVFGSIRAYAAESELRQNPETASFSGDVTLSLDSRQMRADRASYSRAEDRIDISGNVQ